MAPIPVTIVTGFLGAGKTTLLNALLRDPAFKETAVLINEFGDVQIDHDLVSEFSDELIWTTTGCLCCTASSDIKQSLFDLWRRRKDREIGPFKRVIVETTGLIDPVPIVASLLAPPAAGLIDSIVSGQFALAQLVTLFDTVNGFNTIEIHNEAVRQLALSDTVILTMTDLGWAPNSPLIDRARQRISEINPGVRILDRHSDWCEVRELFLSPAGTYDLRTRGEDVLGWLREEHVLEHQDQRHNSHGHDHINRSRHGDDIYSHVITVDEPISPLVINFFLNSLKLTAGTNLLRLKGLFALSDDPDHPVVVHGVQHLVHPIDKLACWPSDDKRTKIAIIGRNFNIEPLVAILNPKQKH